MSEKEISKEEMSKKILSGLDSLWEAKNRHFLLLGFKDLTEEEMNEVGEYLSYTARVYIRQRKGLDDELEVGK